MTDCGCLGHSRPLRRELADEPAGGWTPLGARLTVWRARHASTDRAAIALFGVGLEMLQRIEQGEVEPDAALAERIGRVLTLSLIPEVPPGRAQRAFRQAFHSAAEDVGRRPVPRTGQRAADMPQAVSPAAPLAGEGGGAPTGEAGFLPGPPLCSAPTFALREPDDAPAFIEMTLAGDVFELSIEAADDMHGELLTLLALARGRG